MPTFDLKTLKWSYQQTEPYLGFDNTEGPERPLPRRCHSAVQQACGEWVVVTGGVDERNQTFDDVWKLHLPTLRWHRLNCTLPKRVYFHSAAITAVSLKNVNTRVVYQLYVMECIDTGNGPDTEKSNQEYYLL